MTTRLKSWYTIAALPSAESEGAKHDFGRCDFLLVFYSPIIGVYETVVSTADKKTITSRVSRDLESISLRRGYKNVINLDITQHNIETRRDNEHDSRRYRTKKERLQYRQYRGIVIPVFGTSPVPTDQLLLQLVFYATLSASHQ